MIALTEFAHAGYAGTSLQRIAELAGLSKSSVLYHFASKEALLEAVIAPAIDRMERIVDSIEGAAFTRDSRDRFVVQFADFLLAHRLEVHMFINQGSSLEDVPVVERANMMVLRLATHFSTETSTTEHSMRFAIALGGAAYTLATQDSIAPASRAPVDEIRAALITIVTELLAPVPVRSSTP